MMDEVGSTVRLAVYSHFVETSRAPGAAEIAEKTGLAAEEAAAVFRMLAEDHVLVLRPNGRSGEEEIAMAMPFSATPTSYHAEIGRRSWWANCAWDAFGVLAALGEDGKSSPRTPCGKERRSTSASRAANWPTTVG